MIRRILLSGAVCLAVLASGVSGAAESTALRMVEGEVLEIGESQAEGGMTVLTVKIRDEQGQRPSDLLIALGPEESLQTVGFELEPGDRLRARVFPAESGPALAQKVMNLSRRTMLRLRSLHAVPLWSGGGGWEGGACRTGAGSGPVRGRTGGRGPR